jgi:hypothetical protein
MSPHQSRRSRPDDKAVANAESLPPADSQSPMQRFASLTRALLTVSNKQLKEELHRYENAKSSDPERRKKK